MGEDREDGQGGDARLITAGQRQVFDQEVSEAVKYEKGLVWKLGISLALVALVILVRLFFYS